MERPAWQLASPPAAGTALRGAASWYPLPGRDAPQTSVAAPGRRRAPRDGSTLGWGALTRLLQGPAAPGCRDGACCPLLSSTGQSQPIQEPIPLPPASGSPPQREVKPGWPEVWEAGTGTPAAVGCPALPAGWHGGCAPCPPLPGLLPKGGREPCASPRDCDKHYTEAVNV